VRHLEAGGVLSLDLEIKALDFLSEMLMPDLHVSSSEEEDQALLEMPLSSLRRYASLMRVSQRRLLIGVIGGIKGASDCLKAGSLYDGHEPGCVKAHGAFGETTVDPVTCEVKGGKKGESLNEALKGLYEEQAEINELLERQDANRERLTALSKLCTGGNGGTGARGKREVEYRDNALHPDHNSKPNPNRR